MADTVLPRLDAEKDVDAAVMPRAVYPARLRNDGTGLHDETHREVRLPVGVDRFEIVMPRAGLPSDDVPCMKVRVALSLDGGVTFSPRPSGQRTWPWGKFPIGFTCSGKAQLPDQDVFVASEIPEPQNANRVLRISFVPLRDVDTALRFACRESAARQIVDGGRG